MSYPIAEIRSRFPALAEGAAHFDGPGGSQVPDVVADVVAGVLRSAVSNRGRATRAERRADDIVVAARQAMADLLGTTPHGIVFGRSMTQLTYDMARTLAKDWSAGDEIVVTRLDHDANIRPWVQMAQTNGVEVRWAGFDPERGELDVATIERLLTDRTRLVAVTAASNLLGTRPDVVAIAQRAHAVGALVYLDGVHLTPHSVVDVGALNADFYVCSPYKFLGPHLGVLTAAPELLEPLRFDKLLPATNAVPERFELGTLPYELLAGTTAAVDFLAGITTTTGSRRERIVSSMRAVEEHESGLLTALENGLAEIDGVVRHGAPDRHRTPTVLFDVTGIEAPEVYWHLADQGVNAPAGTFYAVECAKTLGLAEGGAIRAGIAPYTDQSDVDRLIAAVKGLR